MSHPSLLPNKNVEKAQGVTPAETEGNRKKAGAQGKNSSRQAEDVTDLHFFNPALEGVRGMATVFVLIFHFSNYFPRISNALIDRACFRLIDFGWLSVDIFFVLSGFLITRILLDQKLNSPGKYFLNFYSRRILRIFPLYYGYLAACLALLPYLAKVVPELSTGVVFFQRQFLWLALFGTNIIVAVREKSFGVATGHLWSIATEEQFYVVWPFLIYFFSRRNLSKLIAVITLAVIGIPIIYFCFGRSAPFETELALLFSRFFGLGVGAMLAMYPKFIVQRLSEKTQMVFLLVLFAVTIFLGWAFQKPEGTPPMIKVFLVMTTALSSVWIISLSEMRKGSVYQILGSRFFRVVGKYSYGIYVLHPLIRAGLIRIFPAPTLFWGSQLPWLCFFTVAAFSLSFGAGIASHHLWEKPFLNLKRHFD